MTDQADNDPSLADNRALANNRADIFPGEGTAGHAAGVTTGQPNRRRALMLGAVGTAAVISVRPAMAQAVGSVLNCEIPVPGPHARGQNIAADGRLVAADTPGSFVATGRRFTGEQVRAAMRGRSLPGTSYEESQAYVNYIRRLQYGQSGFTCFASLQMPR